MAPLFNLGDLIDRTRDLDRLAIIDLLKRSAPRHVTYSELDRLIGGVAQILKDAGLARGARVAILSLNRTEFVVAYLGIMRAGFVAVPVNIKLPAETIAHILSDSQSVFAFTDHERRAFVPHGLPTIDFDDDGAGGFASRVRPCEFSTVRPDPGDMAQILYTSGSTGMPKGVPLTHAGQLWALCKPLLPGVENERQIVAQPFFHMNGLVTMKSVLRAGSSIVIMPSFDRRAYTEALAQFQVTRVFAVPTMFARVVKELDTRTDLDVSRVRAITLSSAPTTVSMIERVGRAFPNAYVDVSYGTTEAGPSVFSAHPNGEPKPPLALGVVGVGSEVRLVDGQSDDDGVLLMRNPAVMHGYINLPEKSRSVLRDGWYYSGDVMRRDSNGYYYFVGRADDMFVCSGENIYPGEVEQMLEKHPAVQQAAIVPLPDEERGQMPVAFVVTESGRALGVDELKRFALANGPGYQHPRRIAFRSELPWAGTNKVDRNALIQKARELEAGGGWDS